MRVLLGTPGQLTADSASNRAAGGMGPFLLFLGCAAAFFLVSQAMARLDPVPGAHARTAADSAVMALVDSGTFVAAPEAAANAVVRLIGPGVAWTLLTHQTQLQGIIARAVLLAAFLLVPFFAAATLVAWRRTGAQYGYHLTFALHVHGACFLALVVPTALRPLHSGVLAFVASVGVLVYTTWYTVVAARIALGGTTREVNVRLTVAGLLYLPVAMAATLVVALLATRSL